MLEISAHQFLFHLWNNVKDFRRLTTMEYWLIWNFHLRLASCVTLTKPLTSVAQGLHLWEWHNNSAGLPCLLWGLSFIQSIWGCLSKSLKVSEIRLVKQNFGLFVWLVISELCFWSLTFWNEWSESLLVYLPSFCLEARMDLPVGFSFHCLSL